MQTTGIPVAELAERRERLLEHARAEGLSGVVLFDQAYIQYTTGFSFLSNERPIAFAQNAAGDMAVLVPEFEVERTREESSIERIESYPEYPGTEHPMTIWARVLADLGIRDRIGADSDGYPGILGYQGPHSLSHVQRGLRDARARMSHSLARPVRAQSTRRRRRPPLGGRCRCHCR